MLSRQRNGPALAQLRTVYAILAKRAAHEGKSDFVSEVESGARFLSSDSARVEAMECLATVVLEFCPSTCSRIGMPLDEHDECRQIFENHFAVRIFRLAVAASEEAAFATMEGNKRGNELCTSSIKLMATCVAFEYGKSCRNVSHGQGSILEKEYLELPAMCGEFLLGWEKAEWIPKLLHWALQCGFAELLSQARNFVVLLASFCGEIFKHGSDGIVQSHFDFVVCVHENLLFF